MRTYYPLGLYLLFTVATGGYFMFYLFYTKNFVPPLHKKGGNYLMKDIHLIRVKQSVAVMGYLYIRGNF